MTQAFLKSIKAEVLFPLEGSVVTISEEDSVRKGLEILASKGHYLAPVVDSQHHVKNLLSLANIVSFIIKIFNESTSSPLADASFSDAEIEELENKFSTTKIKEIHLLPFQSKPVGTTLDEIVHTFASSRWDRIPILNHETNKVVGIISQATVLQFLAKNLDSLGPAAKTSIGNLGIISSPVRTIEESTRTIVTFNEMISHHFSAFGIMGSDAEMLGVISLKDIQGALVSFKNLILSTQEYIKFVRQLSLKDINPTINVTENDTLERTISKMVAVKIHRVFVRRASESHEFSGIVSLHDVMKALSGDK